MKCTVWNEIHVLELQMHFRRHLKGLENIFLFSLLLLISVWCCRHMSWYSISSHHYSVCWRQLKLNTCNKESLMPLKVKSGTICHWLAADTGSSSCPSKVPELTEGTLGINSTHMAVVRDDSLFYGSGVTREGETDGHTSGTGFPQVRQMLLNPRIFKRLQAFFRKKYIK